MEVLLTLILTPLAIALVIAPIVAWIAFLRTRHIRRELEQVQDANKHLSRIVERVETQASGLFVELGKLRKELKAAQEQTVDVRLSEATDAADAAAPVTLLEEVPEEPVLAEPDVPPDAQTATAPEVPSAEELPSIAAARVEGDTDSVSTTAEVPGEDEIRKPEIEAAPQDREGEAQAEDLIAAQLAPQTSEERASEAEPGPLQHEERSGAPEVEEPARPSRFRRAFSALVQSLKGEDADWETRIGQNWLNILGIIILVIGLVLLIQQSLLLVTPIGKILIGVGVAAVLMASGAYLRRRERYRVFAFTLIGGGWGLLYFTAFASHNIEAAKIIDNEYLAMVVLLAVAGGILGQSLYYARQSVTALAYGLAFLALHLSPLSFYSLVSTAVLAATIPFVIRRTDWRQLGVIIAVATYATHARWLWATELAATEEAKTLILGGLEASQVFWGNVAILVVYWIIFCAAAIAHKPGDLKARSLDFATSMINLIGFLGLVGWQLDTYLPGNLHYIAPPAIIAYVATAFVDGRMERPVLSRLNGTIAIVLYAIAMPVAIESEGLAWDWLSPYWALGGLVVWEIARRLDRRIYRFQAYALTAFAVVASVVVNLNPSSAFENWWVLLAGLSPVIPAALMVETLNTSPTRYKGEPDVSIRLVALIVTPILSGFAVWMVLPDHMGGLGVLVTGYLMFEGGLWTRRLYLRVQGYALGAAGLVLVLIFDAVQPPPDHIRVALLVLSASAAIGYLAGLRKRYAARLVEAEGNWAWVAPGFATVFVAVAVLRWLEVEQAPVVWAAWAVLLLEVGQRLRWVEIRFQSYAMLVAAAGLCAALQESIWINTISSSSWHHTALVALIFHVVAWRTIFPANPLLRVEDRSAIAALVAGAAFYAAVAWVILPSPLVAAGGMVWALVLSELGRRVRREDVVLTGLTMGAASFAFAMAANIYEIVTLPAQVDVMNWVGLAGVICGLYALHFHARSTQNMPWVSSIVKHGAFLHLGTVLFAFALWRELPSVAVAVAWGALAFALIETSERLERWAFVRQAQVLVLAAVIRLFFANFTVPGETFGLSHRLITVGAIIALVYYLRALLVGGWNRDLRLIPAPVFSWIGAALLVILARFEVGREFAVAIWSSLILVFALLGMRLKDRDFRYQAYLLCVLVFGRAWSTNAYLEGTIWNMSERIATTLPSLAALLTVVFLIPRSFGDDASGQHETRLAKAFAFADRHARSVVALLFAAQLALLVFYEMSIDLVSIGWAVSALFLLTIGFALKERSLRLFGLALLLVCLFKVVFVDLVGVETIYRVFSFIVLGLVLLLASLGYSRFRDVLGRYL